MTPRRTLVSKHASYSAEELRAAAEEAEGKPSLIERRGLAAREAVSQPPIPGFTKHVFKD